MKPYEATEAAYKNGYKKGYEDGKADAVEVVNGRWKPVYDYDDGEIDHIAESCSVCKRHVSWFKGRPFNYCPNCGAKMDGDGNG